jgi:hypothetical protein
MKRILFAVLAVALLGLPAGASADSLVYTRDHDIWLAHPDGSGTYQVTTDGSEALPYTSPAQADDGTIVAAHGEEIVRLRQNGEVLSRFDPPAAVDSTGAPIDGVPGDIAVSPDGSRIAFTYARYSCPPAASCGVRQVLLYSYADRATPVATFGEQTNRRDPSWVDGERILLFGGAGAQVDVDSPGGGDDDAVHWFDDEAREDLGDGELSRQGDRLALLRSYGASLHLAIYHVDALGGAVQAACFTGADASLASPSWSPDARSLAFADAEGIEVLPLPAVVAGDCPGATSSHLVVPGGAEPDWGPADVAPAPRQAPMPEAANPTTPAPIAAPCRACGRAAGTALRLEPVEAVGLAKALKRGVTLRLLVPGAGRVVAKAALGGRKVASGTATARRAGTVSVRLRFAPEAARRLRSRHSLRLLATATFRPQGGGEPVRVARVIAFGR